MEKVIRDCFILVQLTRGLALAIAAEDNKGIRRIIENRQACLDSIAAQRKQAGGSFSPDVEQRMRAMADELAVAERANIADMRRMLAGLKIQEKDLHGSMRQLAQIKSGYVPEYRSRPKVFNHYC